MTALNALVPSADALPAGHKPSHIVQLLTDERTARWMATGTLIAVGVLPYVVSFATSSTTTTGGATTTTGTSAAAGDFNSISNTLKIWTEGSLGNVFSLGTLAVGLGLGVVKQTIMPVVVAVGMAAAAKWGPGVLVGISGTVL